MHRVIGLVLAVCGLIGVYLITEVMPQQSAIVNSVRQGALVLFVVTVVALLVCGHDHRPRR